MGWAPNTPTARRNRVGVRVGRWRVGVAQPQVYWGGSEGRFKGQSSCSLAAPSPRLGNNGERLPKNPTPPPTSSWPQPPPSSLLAPEVQRVALTSPGSHTHTLWGIWFCFLKNTYIKKKRYIRNRGRRRDIANVRCGREGDRRWRGGAAEK